MREFHKDQLSEMCYDEQKDIIYHIMYPSTADMSEEEFKQMLLTWVAINNECQAQKAIVYSKDLLFPINPDIQDWIIQEVNPKLPTKQTAFIMPEEFIANLAIEQYITESNGGDVIVMYFASTQEAEAWLLESN
ncbi:hypothetical protein [Eisenibacter elegans]|jgi:hypothetical protein|uniref:hypothetical protein n=1 Tax=Eisenibacter elegans TaxID=997 RepID=UPI00047B83C2|nr:hypothetical protein [Eisenibacter elegans]